MRAKKASINVIVNLMSFVLGVLPAFFVRTAILDSLGNNYLGLSSLYGSVIGFLSIVELGIGIAIIYSLYKPFAEDDRPAILGYLNFYRKVYSVVGMIIFVLGLITTPFLGIFIKDDINLLDAQLYFLMFLLNTLLSYFFSYKFCILTVAQDSYKIAISTTISKLFIAVLQYFQLEVYPNFYVYLSIQIMINALYFLLLNLYINKQYPWINNRKDGMIDPAEKKSLTRNIKALFYHKIGGVLVHGKDNMIISMFLNLAIVGIYNSYMLVIGSLQGLISHTLAGVTASVGNLLATESEGNAFKVHQRFFFLNFWMASFSAIFLYNTLSQFIYVWLGEGQLLDSLTLNILLINFYFFLMRGSVERFKEGGGIYHQDRFAPVYEAIISLIASLILVQVIGLAGVFLGTLISNLTVIFWVKPKVVYKYIFKQKLRLYFITYFKYLAIGIVPLILSDLATSSLKTEYTVYALIANCLLNTIIINGFYAIVFWKNGDFMYYKLFVSQVMKKRPHVARSTE